MRILFTGASSFTGFWFVRELARAGHAVTATFRRRLDAYEGVRGERVRLLSEHCELIVGCSFGSPEFLRLIESREDWDVLCHHAAEVADYKSDDFDVVAALGNNTHNLPRVLKALCEGGCQRVVLTGSVFEQGEGAGSSGLPAFSPYGLSKGLTSKVFEYYVRSRGMQLAKFVISNPFGPFEEPRFTAYLVRSWFEKKTPSVNTPAYVRDNIHVSLLAKAYADFVDRLPAVPGFLKLAPSGFVESQGSFALRFADEMRNRLGLPCELELKQQIEFAEPRIRINTDPLDAQKLGWDETQAWDEVAEYYRRTQLKDFQ